jgi:16S rRNA (guanine527-N7)-methyltransferase
LNNDNVKDAPQGRYWRLPEWFQLLSKQVAERLRIYHIELMLFNGRINLISPTTERHADQVHFADCILGLELIFKNEVSKTIHDIGSGNGFPGLVGGVLYPEKEFVLVEKDGRKAEFLKHMISRLDLTNVKVIAGRLEDQPEGAIETAISRGFAPLPKALLQTHRHFKKGGNYYHFKSESWVAEVAKVPPQLMGIWTTNKVGDYSIPDNGPQLSIVLTKKR